MKTRRVLHKGISRIKQCYVRIILCKFGQNFGFAMRKVWVCKGLDTALHFDGLNKNDIVEMVGWQFGEQFAITEKQFSDFGLAITSEFDYY